jgi:histidine triad (HIT) family protein
VALYLANRVNILTNDTYSLVPKAHVGTLADLPRALVAPRFQDAQRLERAIENSLQAEDPFVALNNRVSQSSPHLHIHLVPHNTKDRLKGFS